MGVRVSSIFAEIGLDSSKFTSGVKSVMGGLGDMIGGLGKTTGVLGAVVGAFGELYKWMDMTEQAAVESAKEEAKLNAVLESTRGISGMTKGSLAELNQEISKSAGLDDELVSAGEAVLLTFTKIGSEVFPDTMQAAADMAAVLGGDLQGKVTMIGKAMNDFSGYTALKRAGVSFTEEQLTQIENFKATNDLMGYQKLILSELVTEYGGAAAAINAAGDGVENLKVAQENLNEAMGESFIPIKRAWNEFWTEQAEGLTDTTVKMNSYNDALDEVMKAHGMTSDQMARARASSKDFNAEIEQEIIDAQNAAIAQDGLAASIEATGNAAVLTDEQIEELNKSEIARYKTSISLAQELTQSDEDLKASEKDLAEYIKANPWDNKGIQTRKEKVEELKQEQQKMVDAWMLNVFTNLSMADQKLSDDEEAFLLKYQVDTGMITQENADRAASYWDMANDIFNANTGIQSSIDGLHGKELTITTIYKSLTAGGTSSTTAQQIAAGVAAGNIAPSNPIRHANGGSFVIGAGYGYEGFNMGGVATASPGETVNISRGDNMADLLAEMQEVRRGLSSLPRELSVAILERAGQIGMS